LLGQTSNGIARVTVVTICTSRLSRQELRIFQPMFSCTSYGAQQTASASLNSTNEWVWVMEGKCFSMGYGLVFYTLRMVALGCTVFRQTLYPFPSLPYAMTLAFLTVFCCINFLFCRESVRTAEIEGQKVVTEFRGVIFPFFYAITSLISVFTY
jgi:hypothetical protein